MKPPSPAPASSPGGEDTGEGGPQTVKAVIACGQEIISPSPAHFIHPQSGLGTGFGVADLELQEKFGPIQLLHVVASHRRHPKCFRAAKQIGLFFFN